MAALSLFSLYLAIDTFLFAQKVHRADPVVVEVIEVKGSRRRSVDVYVEHNAKKYRVKYNTPDLKLAGIGERIELYYLAERDAIIPSNRPEYRFTYVSAGLFLFFLLATLYVLK